MSHRPHCNRCVGEVGGFNAQGADFSENFWIDIGEADVLGVKILNIWFSEKMNIYLG